MISDPNRNLVFSFTMYNFDAISGTYKIVRYESRDLKLAFIDYYELAYILELCSSSLETVSRI